MTLKKPWVLLGGGCTEMHLSAFIRYKSANISSTFLEELNCSSAQYKMVADCFCKSLESVAQSLEHDGGEMLMDLQDGHLWSILPDAASEIGHRCGCRMHRRRDDLQWNVLGSQCSPEIARDKCLLKASHQLILDCFAAKCNGLQVAVDTAGLILDLSYVVEDKN
ncbi:molecular chaperone MKKS-like [Spea bombifrons]|uniref:molecular chaperone MKKS-like n=1 Tax=Spea bombifrons TaxID=233779 RepID=UPI00234BA2CC|nr:molecular chaperone MKKS-like [Spea bombifrons]